MANKKYVIGLDAGTGGVRVILFDEVGTVVSKAISDYPVLYPKLGWAEQEAEWWYDALVKAVNEVIETAHIEVQSIASMAITHQRETTVPVDRDGNPLRNAILWMDRRAMPQTQWLLTTIGLERLLEITGMNGFGTINKVLWVKENQPAIFNRTHKWLLVHDYLVYKLTGHYATSWANACLTNVFNNTSFQWAEDILKDIDVSPDLLPTVYPPGAVVGHLHRNASRITGLPEGLPIAGGGGDQQCGALGCGIIEPGPASLNLGTSVVLDSFSDTPTHRVAGIPGTYLYESGSSGAIALRWFKEKLSACENAIAMNSQIDPYDLLTSEAATAPPGSLGLIMFRGPSVRGDGAFFGLNVMHNRGHIIRAILEGIAFGVRAAVEAMELTSGRKITQVRLHGGGSKSRLWCQIFSDLLQRESVQIQTIDATTLGAAVLAAKGGGLYRSVEDAAKNMVHITERFSPHETNSKIYDKYYRQIYSPYVSQVQELLEKVRKSLYEVEGQGA